MKVVQEVRLVRSKTLPVVHSLTQSTVRGHNSTRGHILGSRQRTHNSPSRAVFLGTTAPEASSMKPPKNRLRKSDAEK